MIMKEQLYVLADQCGVSVEKFNSAGDSKTLDGPRCVQLRSLNSIPLFFGRTIVFTVLMWSVLIKK